MKGSKQATSSPEAEDASRRRNRRQALGLAGVAAAAAAVAAFRMDGGKKAQAAAGDPLTLGQGNDSGTQGTSLSANLKTLAGGPNEPASTLALENSATALGCDDRARALIAESAGEAILGITWAAPGEGGLPAGVRGCSGGPPDWGPGTGVAGMSGSGFGVEGNSVSAPGVAGHSGSAAGVLGRSDTGTGVEGVSHAGIGVYAQAAGGVPAVLAVSAFFGAKGGCAAPPPDGEASIESDGDVEPDGGLALRTRGRVRMDCVRKKRLRNKSNLITLPTAVKAKSGAVIMATMQGSPGNDALIQRAFRVDNTHIRIAFNKKPARRVAVAYWVAHAA